jgi:hypothetical protein
MRSIRPKPPSVNTLSQFDGFSHLLHDHFSGRKTKAAAAGRLAAGFSMIKLCF